MTIPFDAIPAAPEWVLDICARPVRQPQEAIPGFEEDQRDNLDIARYDVDRYWIPQKRMTAGEDRDQITYQFYARMHGLGLSETAATELYAYFIDASRSDPPDGYPDDYKTRSKIERIWQRDGAQNPPGVEMPVLATERFPITPTRPRFYADDFVDLEETPPMQWWDEQLPEEKRVLPRGDAYVGMMVGPFSGFKTFVMLSQMMSASGEPKVLYVNGEGGFGFAQRIRAQRLYRGLTRKDQSGRYMRCPMPVLKQGGADIAAFRAWLIELRRTFKFDIIVIDTLASGLGGQSDIEDVTAQLFTDNGEIGQIAADHKCLVYAIHHTNWDGSKAKDMDSIRGKGSVGWYANCGIVQAVFHPEGSEFVQTRRARFKEGVQGPHTDQYYHIDMSQNTPVPVAVTNEEWFVAEKPPATDVQIRAALLAKQSLTEDKAIASNILAMELYPMQPADNAEKWHDAIKNAAARLDRAAKDHLGYNNKADGGGAPIKWWIR